MKHWGPPEHRGLFTHGSYGRPLGTGTGSLPVYWGTSVPKHYKIGNGSNHLQSTLDYYLNGWRRAGDILRQYAGAVKTNLRSEDPHLRGEAIVNMRLFGQVYDFTRDPALRALVEELPFRHDPDSDLCRTYDPEGEILVSRRHSGTGSTSYKMGENMDAFVELGEILGSRRAYRMAEAVGRFEWDFGGIHARMSGLNAHWLWRKTRKPEMAAGFDFFRRVACTLKDPENYTRTGSFSAMTKYVIGLPLAMDVMAASGADRGPAVSWFAFVADGAPKRFFFRKPKLASVELLARFPSTRGTGDYSGGDAGGGAILKPHALAGRVWVGQNLHNVKEFSAGNARVRVPKEAPGGAYELLLPRPIGPKASSKITCSVFADRRAPLALYAPEGWTPVAMNPPVRVYFRVPKKGGRIFFKNGARLFTPDGKPFREGKELVDWVDLSGAEAGLWSFEAVDPGRVRTENLPGFFAMGDPAFYLEPKAGEKGTPSAP